LRGGAEREIAAREVVPGDVIGLRVGNRIPADARLIEVFNLQIQEAPLTGESVPVEKQTEALSERELTIGDRVNMAFSGSTATYGRGLGVVVATAADTEIGKISRLLQEVYTDKTPLQKDLDKLGGSLARAALAIVTVIVILGLFRGQPFLEMFVFGIALAVAVVPEALPAVVTISLAIGVQRLVKRHALIRRLPAVETLGSTSVICADKTGTLTKDELTTRRIHIDGQMIQVSGAGYEPSGSFSKDGILYEPSGRLKKLLEAAALASDASIVRSADSDLWHVQGDPTEGALVAAAAKAGLEKVDLEAQFPRVGEIPFTSETKRMTTIHSAEGNFVAHSKGAPEVILESCNQQLSAGEENALESADREEILEMVGNMAGKGLRVLGVASKKCASMENAENGMTFLGLVGMIDPPRAEAKTALRTCEDAGIRTVMITGDHPATAEAIARELGLLKRGRVVTGVELEAMNDDKLEDEVEEIDVFARVSPAHKLRVVTALQKKGHVIAMTGDGVNDAPALKKADIGIAMGITGTDVAREAAEMTLLDDNFASIVAAVEEGRGIFGNVKKYLSYLLSSNIGEIGLMAGATLFGLPLPLTAVQILYVNLATDGLPALALAVDPPESDLMQRRPRDSRTSIFTRPVVALMTIGGLWSTIVNVSLFWWALNSGRSTANAMTMTFVSLVLIQLIKAYNFRSDRISVLYRPFANKWLNLAVLWELMALLLVVYLPVLHEPFGTYGLTLTDWAIAAGLALTILPVLEFAKRMIRQGWFGGLD
jgi:Ca2+-transporting ATPase